MLCLALLQVDCWYQTKKSNSNQYEGILTRMEGSAADLWDSDYTEINSGGEFSSSDKKSRYKSRYMLTRSQGKLHKWEGNFKMWQSYYGGMNGGACLCLGRLKDPKDDDWRLADGVSLTMYLWVLPDYKKKQSWNPWVSVRKLTIDNAGNGLFCCKRIPERRDCWILCR
jgi:hypothetical protein